MDLCVYASTLYRRMAGHVGLTAMIIEQTGVNGRRLSRCGIEHVGLGLGGTALGLRHTGGAPLPAPLSTHYNVSHNFLIFLFLKYILLLCLYFHRSK